MKDTNCTPDDLLDAVRQSNDRMARLEMLLAPPADLGRDPIQLLLDRQERIEHLLMELISVVEDATPT